ncbi:MAG: hypothetical protein BZ138_04405 [Methanosphaera sp. rholeuAM270]|nr:MAG: hypothetical protein BZ138_04405 [Methanosphaera sp. rholeuAM270]
MKTGLYEREISIESTHLHLQSDLSLDIDDFIRTQRTIISNEIIRNPDFKGYEPVDLMDSPRILKLMTNAGQIAEIGPMSSVAGSISQVCMEYLVEHNSQYSVLENGGDIALRTDRKIILGVYAGESVFTDEIALKLKAKRDGYGICTSSGSVGPSKSFGKTDATIVFSKTASIADSLATRIANYGNGHNDDEIVNASLEKAEEYREHFDGVIVIKGEYMAKIGHIPKIISVG